MILEPVDSKETFKSYWWYWKVIGVNTGYNKYLCGVYDFFIHLIIVLYYPLHLIIALFINSTKESIFKSLAINITVIACSLKHYCYRYKLRDIERIQEIFMQLDKRASNVEERSYFNQQTKVAVERVINIFTYSFGLTNIFGALTVILGSERRIMYPAWFPFDWMSNTYYYVLAFCFQFFGISLQIMINIANNSYSPMSLCLFAGHVHMLGMRVARIGHDALKTKADNEHELVACIKDHKLLIDVFHLLQGSISFAQLTQFFTSGLNICIVLFYLLFYVNNLISYIHYTMFFMAMAMEIFPSCYYSSVLEKELEALSHAIYCSNWTEQTRKFRQNQIIFTELALRKFTPLAGGIINIHLTSFLATCKMAYSLFTVVRQVN